jgi:hypothetical protein
MTDPNAPNRRPLDLAILDEVGLELGRIFRREEQTSAPARHGVRPPRRRSGMRVAAAAVLVALIAAAVAVAAGGLFGSPVAPEERLTPTTGWGVPIPSSVRLIPISAPDPAGGLPWGIRIMHTTRGLGCIQFGRLSGGALWVIGQDGAFHDDGRLHQLSADIFEPEGCTSLDAHGHTFIAAGRVAVPASGYVPGCNGPEGNNGARPARHRPCPPQDERALFYGALGPQAKSITYTLDGHTVSAPTAGPDGAYLIVTRAQPNADPNVGGPHSPNGSNILPQGGLQQPIRTIDYRDGYVCHISASDDDTHGQPCTPPGYAPAPIDASAAQVRAPVSAHVLVDRSETHRPGRAEDVQISFTARVPILRSGEYYKASIISPCIGASAQAEPPNAITAGQRVTIRFVLSSIAGAGRPCKGVYRGSVRLVAQPFYFDEPPSLSSRPPALSVGSFSIRVP